MNYTIYLIAAIAFAFLAYLTARYAHKVVFGSDDSVARSKGKNGDVSFDEICEDFLKLTNLGDVHVP